MIKYLKKVFDLEKCTSCRPIICIIIGTCFTECAIYTEVIFYIKKVKNINFSLFSVQKCLMLQHQQQRPRPQLQEVSVLQYWTVIYSYSSMMCRPQLHSD